MTELTLTYDETRWRFLGLRPLEDRDRNRVGWIVNVTELPHDIHYKWGYGTGPTPQAAMDAAIESALFRHNKNAVAKQQQPKQPINLDLDLDF